MTSTWQEILRNAHKRQPQGCASVLLFCGPRGLQASPAFQGLNEVLKHKGVQYTGSTDLDNLQALPHAPGSQVASPTLYAYFTYLFPFGADPIRLAHGRDLCMIRRIINRFGVELSLLGPEQACRLVTHSDDCADLVAEAHQGDRCLSLGRGETFLADLSANLARSSVWLVRRNGKLAVRKSYSAGYEDYYQREILARQILNDKRVAPIEIAKPLVLYMPYYTNVIRWRNGMLSRYPERCAAEIFDFLEYINAHGYSMVDINHSCFVFDKEVGLRVIDLEFFTKSYPAASFRDSADYSGAFAGIRRPRCCGYHHYWYEILGGNYEQVIERRPRSSTVSFAFHVIGRRLPHRIGRKCGKLTRSLIAAVSVRRRTRNLVVSRSATSYARSIATAVADHSKLLS